MNPIRQAWPHRAMSIIIAAVMLLQATLALADTPGQSRPCEKDISHCTEAVLAPDMDCCIMAEACATVNLVLFQTVPNIKVKNPKMGALQPVLPLDVLVPLARLTQKLHHISINLPASNKIYQINAIFLR